MKSKMIWVVMFIISLFIGSAHAQEHDIKIAVVNPDSFRIVKFGWMRGECFTSQYYYSIACGTEFGPCHIQDPGCWSGVGEQQDFIGTILSGAGYSVDYFTADDLPSITATDYDILVIQDPLKDNARQFPKNVEDVLPNLLEYVTSPEFISKMENYFNSGGRILLVGDAVQLLEDFGKLINIDVVSNALSNPTACVPQKWLFERGNPFCCLNRTANGTYSVESSSLLPRSTILSNISLFDGHDIPHALTWSDVVYYPSDGTSLLDVHVQGTGEYVLRGDICNPPVYTVTVDDVLSNFMGYTLVEDKPIFYLGSDTYFDYYFLSYEGAWHCGESLDMRYTITNEGKQVLLNLIDLMLTANQPPTAYIDEIAPNPAANYQGQILFAPFQGHDVVIFVGHGEDTDGFITEYLWSSSIDGNLSTEESFNTSDLSPGIHEILFRVKDNQGEWSTPVMDTLRVIDGFVFRPPHDSCDHGKTESDHSEAKASCNASSGALSAYAKAWLGGDSYAWAQQYVGRIYVLGPTMVQVETEVILVGGEAIIGIGGTDAMLGLHIYKEIGDEGYIRFPFAVRLGDPWEWEFFSSALRLLLGPFGGWEGTILDAVTLFGEITNARALQEALKTGEHTIYRFVPKFWLEPGSYLITGSLQSLAVASVGWAKEARLGQLQYITIQEIGIGPEDELIISGYCPIDLVVSDPEGRTINKASSDIPYATYVEADIDLDGDLDDQIYIPDALDGLYTITVEPDSGADPTETFSLLISYEGESFVGARDVEISSIPDEPYVFLTGTASVNATIDIDPDVLNLRSRGRWITCYIELPDEYDVNDIDIASVFFNRTIPAESSPYEVGDYDSDGIADLMVKFDRAEVRALLTPDDSVEMLVVGEVGEDMFEGIDTIRVIMPSGGPAIADQIPQPIPNAFFVSQNYPNPFSSSTTISYVLPKSSHVTLTIYNVAGQVVKTLVDGILEPGYYTAEWDTRDTYGNQVPSGIYFYRLSAGEFTDVKKMLLLR